MPLADEIKTAIDHAVAQALSKVELRAGTIVLSPSYEAGDPLTVVFDGSAVAVEVKMIRAFNVFPNARVVCARIGVDWTAIGVYIDPSQGNIVSGIPGGGRIEFDPHSVNGKVYDSDGNLVIELDQTTGVTVYDPQGNVDNRIRIVTETGQLVLSQVLGESYRMSRLYTTVLAEGTAAERPYGQWIAPGHEGVADQVLIEMSSESVDGSEDPHMNLQAVGDAVPGRLMFTTDGAIEFWGLASDSTVEFHNVDIIFNEPHVRVFRNGAFSVVHNTWAAVSWDQESWDFNGEHSTITNPSRITASTPGRRVIKGQVTITNNDALTVANDRSVMLRINAAGNPASGTLLCEVTLPTNTTLGNLDTTVPFNVEWDPAVGDYVEIFWRHRNGGGDTLSGHAGSAYTYAEMSRITS